MSNSESISQPVGSTNGASDPSDAGSSVSNENAPNEHTASNGHATEHSWSNSRSLLKGFVDEVHQASLEGAERLDNEVRSDYLIPFFESFSNAATTHELLAKELAAALENDEVFVWPALLAYRRQTQDQVMGPLNEKARRPFFELLGNQVQRYFDSLEACIAPMPQTQVIPEPPNLFSRRPDDGTWTRFHKSRVRFSRWSTQLRHNTANSFRKLFGRTPQDPYQRTQLVQLQELLRFHVGVRIPQLLSPNLNALEQILAANLAAFEKAQTEWTYELLEFEQGLSGARHDLPEMEVWQQKEPGIKPVDDTVKTRILNIVEMLQNQLIKIGEATSPSLKIDEAHLEPATEKLYRDFKHSGTFLLEDRSMPDMHWQPVNAIKRTTKSWSVWHTEVINRLKINARLEGLRDALLRAQQGILDQVANASIIPILKSFSRLRGEFVRVNEAVIQICSKSAQTEDYDALVQQLKPLHKQISKQFDGILNDVTDLLRAGQVLESPGASYWNHLQQNVETLPNQVAVHETTETVVSHDSPAIHRYQIHLNEIVQAALRNPLPVHLKPTAKTLQKAVIQTWEETQQVRHMVDYNLKTAFAELLEDPNAEAPALNTPTESTSETPLDPVEAAQELITNGLSRSTEKLEDLVNQLSKPWDLMVDRTCTAIKVYSNDVLHDVREADHMNDRWTNFKTKVNRYISKQGQRVDDLLKVTSDFFKRVVTLGRRQTKQLIRKGQSAVGVVAQNEDQWLASLELASDVDALHKKLPLVYRRLFSLMPLADLDLLEGRKLDVAFVTRHYAQWKKSQTGPLLLSMPAGSGRTSFMNVLVSTIFTDAEVKSLNLPGRISDVDDFAAQVASLLDLPANEGRNIERLEAEIVQMKRGQEPMVLVIDKFEHLLLCSPGGHELIERVLIFMSRTDNLIYWVINVSTHAWHFLEKTISPSSGFISAYNVTPLHRQALEDIILKRHNRSGMSLHFRPSGSSKGFLGFSRSGNEEAMQEMHRNAFFERLSRLSGQNILLALLYWLRSIEFDQEEDTLFVNPIDPINFSFLDTLDLPRAFTMKSFLTHGTLTLQEHMRIFKMPQTESTFILESLLNLRIIEPANKSQEEGIHFRIEKDVPYRLHPLIVHPVLALLKKRHIVY